MTLAPANSARSSAVRQPGGSKALRGLDRSYCGSAQASDRPRTRDTAAGHARYRSSAPTAGWTKPSKRSPPSQDWRSDSYRPPLLCLAVTPFVIARATLGPTIRRSRGENTDAAAASFEEQIFRQCCDAENEQEQDEYPDQSHPPVHSSHHVHRVVHHGMASLITFAAGTASGAASRSPRL